MVKQIPPPPSHLVWTRDIWSTAPQACSRLGIRRLLQSTHLSGHQPAAGWRLPQNFWINGEAYWGGIQLDEVAFPILLAWRLRQENALQDFDPYPMVMRATGYLIRNGPATQQERWEEAEGYSPSTLAASIAALICAAVFARERGDEETAKFIEEYADFLDCHIEDWTVTTEGTLVPGIERYFIRIHPVSVYDLCPNESPNRGILTLANQQPGVHEIYSAKEIVDAGFLELVRYGIRKPDDPLIVDSLRVVDAVLKVKRPAGLSWRRYSHDGYGQREDGGAFKGWGKGRAWPLLTGEWGHYELAAGQKPTVYSRNERIRHNGGFAARASMGRTGSSRGSYVSWAANRRRHAADVGAR